MLGATESEEYTHAKHISLLVYTDQQLYFYFHNGLLDNIQWTPRFGADDQYTWPTRKNEPTLTIRIAPAAGRTPMEPFHLTYTLTRRQRLAVELPPWLPAVAAALGFTFGAAFLSLNVSRWFLIMLLLPPVVYRGLFVFAFDIAFRGGRAVELIADDVGLEDAVRGVT